MHSHSQPFKQTLYLASIYCLKQSMFRYFYWNTSQTFFFILVERKREWKVYKGIPSLWSLSWTCYSSFTEIKIRKPHKQTFSLMIMRAIIEKGKKNKRWLRVKVSPLCKHHLSLHPDEKQRDKPHKKASLKCRTELIGAL